MAVALNSGLRRVACACICVVLIVGAVSSVLHSRRSALSAHTCSTTPAMQCVFNGTAVLPNDTSVWVGGEWIDVVTVHVHEGEPAAAAAWTGGRGWI